MATGPTNAGALPSGQNQPVPESPTTHKVIFIDPFGVVNEQWVENGTNAILPTPRVHEYLTFVEWNQSTENVTEDRVIGAIYNTTDGKTYVKIRLTNVTGLSPILNLNKSDNSTLTIDWGDSTTSTFTNSGNFSTGAHSYPWGGDYIITIWISIGSGTYGFGNNSSSYVFIGNTQQYKNVILSLYIGDSVISVAKQAFTLCKSLLIVSFSCYIQSIGFGAFQNCIGIETFSLPNSITIIDSQAFYGSSLRNISIPNSIINFESYTFPYCYSLYNISVPQFMQNIKGNTFFNCTSILRICLPNTIQSIKENAFNACSLILQYKIYAIIPPTLENINAFTGINSICKIYVPDASLIAYKSATNWAYYANYIYPLSDIGE